MQTRPIEPQSRLAAALKALDLVDTNGHAVSSRVIRKPCVGFGRRYGPANRMVGLIVEGHEVRGRVDLAGAPQEAAIRLDVDFVGVLAIYHW